MQDRQTMEQSEESFKQMAQFIAIFYNELIEKHVPAEHALIMTETFIENMSTSHE